ncbi:MAG: SurA N-terminal domain-containing protein [Ignavibacteria bacterium]|nr:SurA N-terminal domain-containing protein [Ignavibacteria bacterium]
MDRSLQKKKKVHRPQGIMNKMRDKMPLIIIILIIAFLGTIIFEWGMDYMGMSGQSTTFGEVNGVEITYQEYEQAVQQQVEQMRLENEGKDIDEATMEQIREQVWNNLVTQTLTRQEINKLGIKVSDAEILDWIYNRPETLPEVVKRNFMDSTGVFNMAVYQQALGDKRPEVREFWSQVENYLRETILSEKLQSIIVSSVIVTEGDVLQKYKDDNIIANFDFISLSLNSITDTSINNVSDEELRKYYDEHLDEFKQEEAVRFRYVIFSDAPTAEDSAVVEKQLNAYIEDFKNSSIDDSSLIKLVNDISESPFDENFKKLNTIGKGALDFLVKAQQDEVSNLIIDQDGYKVVRFLGSKEGDDLYANASHIMVNFGTDTLAAKKKAEDILKRAKGNEKFEDLAFMLSEDPSAKQNRGDLGWFTKGAMVPEFETAAMDGNVGDIIGPIKTQYGFHILKIKGKSKKEFKFAELKMTVKSGSRTKDAAKKGAEDFIFSIEEGANIDTLALTLKMPVLATPEVTRDGVIPGAGQNKSLISFGFESDIYEMDGPFRIQGGYGVYQLVEKIPEGYKNFDSIKTTLIQPKVVMEKKFALLKQVADDLMGKIQNSDLNSLTTLDPNYIVETADSVSVSKPYAKIGMDYAFNNVVFNMTPGELSNPIKGNNGYYIVKLKSITPFNQQDYMSKGAEIRNQLMQTKQQAVIQEWLANLQNKADIIDNRDRFF